jgi:hypothetical protein
VIDPSAVHLLRTIDAALADKVAPSVTDLTGRSALATIRHLLRLVRVRIENEGQILNEEAYALRVLLGRIGVYLRTTGDAGVTEADKIDAALGADQPDPDRYPDLLSLGVRVNGLRTSLHDVLMHLTAVAAAHANDAAYTNIRDAIRKHLGWQVMQEDQLVAAAFYGQGPRR